MEPPAPSTRPERPAQCPCSGVRGGGGAALLPGRSAGDGVEAGPGREDRRGRPGGGCGAASGGGGRGAPQVRAGPCLRAGPAQEVTSAFPPSSSSSSSPPPPPSPPAARRRRQEGGRERGSERCPQPAPAGPRRRSATTLPGRKRQSHSQRCFLQAEMLRQSTSDPVLSFLFVPFRRLFVRESFPCHSYSGAAGRSPRCSQPF